VAYLLLYVDDIILTASSQHLLQHLIGYLQQEFAMTDLGHLHYFLGVSVQRSSASLFLSQAKYAAEILEKANMSSAIHPRLLLKFSPSCPPKDDHLLLILLYIAVSQVLCNI
jgi:hypothetical protein